MDANPLLDFHTPWVALIQLALTYLLPRLVGLVTDKLAASSTKIVLLGVLSIVASGLTYLLTIAVADSWATADWTALLNILVNSAITFALAQGVFTGVIKPLGQADKDGESNVIQLFKANPERLAKHLALNGRQENPVQDAA